MITDMKKIVITLLAAMVVLMSSCGIVKNPYVQEYIPGQGNIKGEVDTEDFMERDTRFEIGATAGGYAVFKDPDAAFDALLEDYSDGIELIRAEFELQPISKSNYEPYATYGCQVTTGTEEEQDQAYFVSGFLDIYENSFN